MPKEPWCSGKCQDEMKWKQELFEKGKDYYPFEWSRYKPEDRKVIIHLEWVKDRLVQFHGDNENVDFIARLGEIIQRLKDDWRLAP